jgi:predicted nucleotidyltransferase
MINILPEHLEIIKVILRKHLPSHAKVWVFGSRTTQKIKKFSDLDLAIDMGQPLSLRLTGNLKEDFSESLYSFS